MLSHVQLVVTPWTVAHQAPPSMGFSRQEYWSGLPCPSPGDLPDPGIEPRSPVLEADTLTSEPPRKPYVYIPWPLQAANRILVPQSRIEPMPLAVEAESPNQGSPENSESHLDYKLLQSDILIFAFTPPKTH